MLSFVRRRVTFANVAMTVALVFAMSGGAFAAGKFLITSTKQIKPSVLASLKGKAGPAGANGAQGSAGPAGAMGPAGAAGPQGAAGAKGETGAEGKEGKAGKDGKAGVAGSPWTAGGTLPSGKTETGEWAFGDEFSEKEAALHFPVASFAIPLAAPLTSGHAHYINTKNLEVDLNGKEVTSTACKGTEQNPTAEPGNLCVYTRFIFKAIASSAGIGAGAEGEADTAGTPMEVIAEPGGVGQGTWAVTAE